MNYHKKWLFVRKIYRNGSQYMRHVSVISEHPIFAGSRELTGCQRDPRIRGVTARIWLLRHDTILYSDRGGLRHGTHAPRNSSQEARHDLRHSRMGPQYDAQCATTRRPARDVRAAWAQCAQPGPWVCTMCTRPGFDSVHCLQ